MITKDLLDFFRSQNDMFVGLLKQFVSMQTYSGEVERIDLFMDEIEGLFKEFCSDATRIPTDNGDILTLSFFPEKNETVVWLAHADTVQVGESFPSVKIENDRFYGNGSFDMKNGIALFYFALKAFHELEVESNKQVRLIFTPDEEIGSKGSREFLSRACRGAKAVLLPEPCCPNGGIKTRRKGIATVRARCAGRAAHSGIEPEKGKDANRALVGLVNQIDAVLSDFSDVSFNPGLLSGGVRVNIVSPESRFEGELRSFSNDSLKKALDVIQGIRRVGDVDVNISVEMCHPALEFDEKNQRLYGIAKKIAEEMDYDLPSCESGGGSDGSDLSDEGIPVIDGLGMRGGGAHSAEEYVELSDFPYRAALIARLTQEI